MAIRVERQCFETTDEALNQLRSLGLWPTTLHLPAGPELDLHCHAYDVHAYVVNGDSSFIDPGAGTTHEITVGDKLLIEKGTAHAEGETQGDVTYLIGLPELVYWGEFLEQLPPG